MLNSHRSDLTHFHRNPTCHSYCECHDEIYHTTFCHQVVRKSKASLNLSPPTQTPAHTYDLLVPFLFRKDYKLSIEFSST